MTQPREEKFKEWASLEPRRCSPHGRGGFVVGKTHFQAFNGVASDALLRREVQRALADRSWSWHIDLGYPVHAFVTFSDSGRRSEGAATEFPGEALLDAYLEALRSAGAAAQ